MEPDLAAQSAPRSYRSTLRTEQADRTRRLIAEAARERFLATGWAGTSVRAVAAEAGVSEATVYAAYGSKAALARSLVDSVDAEGVPRLLAALERKAGDPAGQIAALVAYDRRLFEHGGSVLRVIAEGRRTEPDLAAAYREGRRRGDDGRRRVFGTWPDSAWRPGVTPERAVDIYAVLVSIESYDVATTERGWTPAHLQRWWCDVLVAQLLA